MSAQVTEAHRELARDVIFSVKAVAQLIADSEARAVAEWQDFVHLKGQSIDSLLLECNQLRAEVERLREWQASVIANERLHYDERKDAIVRAEKAEAELAEQKWLEESAVKRAKELTEELAAERARLDWFANYGDTCWHDQTMGVLRGEDGAEFYADSFRAAIDAAMKEDGA